MLLQITPLERAALQLLANGKELRELTNCLGLSEQTVDLNLTLLFARMGADGPGEAVATAKRRGLLVDV
jgi:DNA-binding CsgD family transcriptional regulator